MLKATYTLLLLILFTVQPAWSKDTPDIQNNTEQNNSLEYSHLTIKADTSSLEKTLKDSIKQVSEKLDSKEKQESDNRMVTYTLFGICANALLIFIAIWQGWLSRRSFITDQRPWVVVDKVIPVSELDLKSGLTFTFIVKNAGKSPGTNVDVSATMHLPHRGDIHESQRNLRDDFANTRKRLIRNKEISYGKLLTPGSDLSITVRAANEPIEYQKAAAATSTGEIIIFIVGQVSYRFDANKSWHESGFIFSVSRKGGKWVTLEDEVTPASDIEIKAFGAGFYTT